MKPAPVKIITILFFIVFAVINTLAIASDYKKEQRWANQIVDYLIDGDAQWLTVNQHKFLSIYTQAQTLPATGAAIIIHGSGVHPNWEEVILPLRTALPEKGWSTLSIQMPVLANDADYSEYANVFIEVTPRIEAAIQYLQKKGIKHIVIIAHSLGSTMSAYYLSSNPKPQVQAFVAIGMPGTSKDVRMNNIKSLAKINIPVLDLYGSNDLSSVIDSAKARKQAAANNPHYSQHMSNGANHFFSDNNAELIKLVSNWLNK